MEQHIMMATVEGSRGAKGWVPRELLSEIKDVIAAIDLKIGKGSAPALRAAILAGLMEKEWSGEVAISFDSDITITSAKNRIGLCIQTGNMARIYADLLKLEKLNKDGAIIAGIILLPCMPCAKKIGSNVANSERLWRELKIFDCVLSTPLAVVSLE
jgi:hypothetical protein